MVSRESPVSKEQHIKTIARRIQSLPTLPPVVKKLTAMVESPEVTAKDVGKLISSDQVLSAKVLKLVNSSFYGLSGKVSSISHAVILLGFNVIKGVVLSASVFDIMERSMVGLWEHSLGTAIISGTISRNLGLSEPEEISTAALLHDIGKVLVRVSLSEDYDCIVRIAGEQGRAFREAELEVLGVDHADIGSWLSREWGLPRQLIAPITYHHDPGNAPGLQDRVAVVHIADSLAHAFGVGGGPDGGVPRITELSWNLLGMPGLDLTALMRKILVDLEEVENYKL